MSKDDLKWVRADLERQRARRVHLQNERVGKARQHAETRDTVAQLVADGRRVTAQMRNEVRDLVADLETIDQAIERLGNQIEAGERQESELKSEQADLEFTKAEDRAVAAIANLDSMLRAYATAPLLPAYEAMEAAVAEARAKASAVGLKTHTVSDVPRVYGAWHDHPGLEGLLNAYLAYVGKTGGQRNDSYSPRETGESKSLAFR